jgi:hypothetical protein
VTFPAFVNAGEPWAVARQPAWVGTEIQAPAAGVL